MPPSPQLESPSRPPPMCRSQVLRTLFLPALLLILLACDSTDVTQPGAADQVFAQDFRDHPNGSSPQGWLPAWNVAQQRWEVQHEAEAEVPRLVHASSADAHRLLAWMEVGTPVNVEIVARVQATELPQRAQNRLIVRARGGPADETGYALELWQNRVRIVRLVEGSETPLAEAEGVRWEPNRWYWLRFRAEGSRLQARFWEDDQPEPPGWTFETTDELITEAGVVGVGAHASSGTRQFTHLAVGVGGATAPIQSP